MNTQSNYQQKPTLVSVIAWMTLASGIVNLFWGVAASGTALATIIGIFCTPLTILPTILGVFEIIYAAKLLGTYQEGIKPSTNMAAFEIACVLTGNVFSMAVGILALVFYNDTTVRDYFARINGMPVPVTPVTATGPASITEPASLSNPEPASVIQEPDATSESESVTPASEETPAKPKRTPRKMANG